MTCKGPEYIDCQTCGTHHSAYEECPIIISRAGLPCIKCNQLNELIEWIIGVISRGEYSWGFVPEIRRRLAKIGK